MTITIDKPVRRKGAMQPAAMQETPRRGGVSRRSSLQVLRRHARLAVLVWTVVLSAVLGCALAQKTQHVATGQASAQRGLRMESPGQEHPETSRRNLLMLAAFPLALLFGVGAAVAAARRDVRMHGDAIEPHPGAPAELEPEAEAPAHAEWDIPVLASVPAVAAAGAETPITVRRGFAGEAGRGPVLVEEFAAGEEPLHEKMTPELSGRREAPSAGGEAGMRRTTSWLDRLLGRNASSAGIVSDDRYGRDSASDEPVLSAGVRSAKAGRLDPILRQGTADPAWTEKVPTRLQIVPDEPFEIVVPSSRALLDAGWAGREIEAPVESIAAARVQEPGAVEATAEPLLEDEENRSAMGVQTSSPDDRGARVRPARPLSFQQLTELTQQQMPPQVSEPIAEPVVQVAPVTVAAEVMKAEPPVQKAAALPVMESERAIEPQTHRAPPVSPKREVAPAVRQVAAAQAEDSWVKIRAHQPVAKAEEPVFAEAGTQEYPEQYEADDIEPVYEEVSRHLTSGRWDPIPTLRPDSSAWRDRPSPVPPSNPAFKGTDRPRWTGVDEDQEASTRDAAASQGYRTEPLPEPLLTRQWGLLSKFQQARISSGDRPVAKTVDEDRPAKNGDR